MYQYSKGRFLKKLGFHEIHKVYSETFCVYRAVKDVKYVIHVASPFPTQTPKEESELIQPAVEGTQAVLKACVAAKSVKRVVLTSSCAAVGCE